MTNFLRLAVLAALVSVVAGSVAYAQHAPDAPDRVWHSSAEQSLDRDLAAHPEPVYHLDPQHAFTLAELVDVAESHNPETRVAWEAARAKAAALGIARSALYPTIAAVVMGSSIRQATLIGEYFHRQTIGLFEPEVHVEYLVFDFGERGGAIDVAKANLLAANLAFNDTHRKIIFEVASAYYKLLNAQGQREAAEISLKNAETVEEDAQSRLDNGLATKPDVLEATAARAQAAYELQSAVGANDIARGTLATVLGLPPDSPLKVQDIDALQTPKAMTDSVDQEIDRAFKQRPELMAQMARLRAVNGEARQARSAFFPTVSFAGDGGLARAYGQQDLLPGHYAEGEVWTATLDLKWTVFDGTRREHELAQAAAERRAAQAGIDALRDQIANEVWTAYTDMRTALRQQQAAAALLSASSESYQAARESYGYGVRNLLDVVSAQKTLAQARSEDILARAQLLLQTANLAFRTADLIQTQPPKVGP